MKQWADYPIKRVKKEDKHYPVWLKEISDPPAILYYKGQLPQEKYRALAAVGSRKYTHYGQQVVEELIPPVARAGIVLVSGLALGIDSFVHRAALRAGGITWAVLAGGLTNVYPSSHYQLAGQILRQGGAVFSEEKPATPVQPFRFPKRNRIIAGLSEATLVIEAAERSGSLITARLALEYNRSVLAVPQNINALTGRGSNWLISEGARLVSSPADILDEFGLDLSSVRRQSEAQIENCGLQEKKIIQALALGAQTVDQLANKTSLSASQLNRLLINLTLQGMIRRLADNSFCLGLDLPKVKNPS